ncbi:stalk domain-containing protein [Cellulosilyticum sp. I15G10I2]|uniref:stalk domain-containing protein n=1 Tax=Cellulosilyticum sp. I15G10I2 TaxID=1892843 RepID=UPI00085C6AEE|nr:stalk domain-containing protein [Cellulosilyticum sp. I15G10I2]
MIRLNLRKSAAIGMCCIFILSGTVWAAPSNTGIGIQVNGRWLLIDAEPFIENNNILIPLRGVMENLGAKVEWQQERGSVAIHKEAIHIELFVNKNTATVIRRVGGTSTAETLKLEVPAKIVEGRTFIPGRFVAEALGAKVDWNQSLHAMIIKSSSEGDMIGVERRVYFEIVDPEIVQENEVLKKWHQDNFKTEGIYALDAGNWKYVLAAAGEQPTGGYRLIIDSITEVIQGTGYVHAVLAAPEKNDFVTQALTYPNVVVRFHKGSIEKIQGDFTKQQQNDEESKRTVEDLTKRFGKQLQVED